jgi:hypothetical protein
VSILRNDPTHSPARVACAERGRERVVGADDLVAEVTFVASPMNTVP